MQVNGRSGNILLLSRDAYGGVLFVLCSTIQCAHDLVMVLKSSQFVVHTWFHGAGTNFEKLFVQGLQRSHVFPVVMTEIIDNKHIIGTSTSSDHDKIYLFFNAAPAAKEVRERFLSLRICVEYVIERNLRGCLHDYVAKSCVRLHDPERKLLPRCSRNGDVKQSTRYGAYVFVEYYTIR